jgi:hypothetical protein
MHFKTIALELLTANPDLHRRLKADPQLLHQVSAELKISHLVWLEQLTARSPSTDPRLLRSQALELAVEEVVGRLTPSASPASEWAEDYLDGAMAFLRSHTPPG